MWLTKAHTSQEAPTSISGSGSRKCLENKFLIFIDNEDFFETKVGIITNLENNKIKIKEIDKYGNFYKNSEIYLDEIQLLAVKNYRLEL